jgi:hypothetical protein
LMALAKYYFLERLAALDDPSDSLKLKHGVSLSKSPKQDLKHVCREFEEEARKTSSAVAQAADAVEQVSDESELSDPPSSFLEVSDDVIKSDVPVAPMVSGTVKETVQPKDIRASKADSPALAATESMASHGKHDTSATIAAVAAEKEMAEALHYDVRFIEQLGYQILMNGRVRQNRHPRARRWKAHHRKPWSYLTRAGTRSPTTLSRLWLSCMSRKAQ